MALDALGRRTRLLPTSSGKSITLQPADLLWFRKLYEHGPLPSSYLLQFSEHLRVSRKRATERLTDLFNEATTKHGGPYLIRPPQQFRTIDSRYNRLVYDLGCSATTILSDAVSQVGRWLQPEAGRSPGGGWSQRRDRLPRMMMA